MQRLIPIVLFLGIFFLLDFYCFGAVKSATQKPWIRTAYWVLHIFFYVAFLFFFGAMIAGKRPTSGVMVFYSVILAFYIPKLLALPILALEDIVRSVKWITSRFSANPDVDLSRNSFLSKAAIGVTLFPFASVLYGIARGKYRYTVHSHSITLPNLPKAFDGLKIVQISDLHTGSFDSKASMKKGIEMAMAQNADIIFFTGDLINNYIDETDGYDDIYSMLKAPLGVFSILGNHDYSDYVPFESVEAKAAHLQQVIQKHKDYGWDILLDEHRYLERDGQKIALVGVQNWGTHFAKKGDIHKAMKDVDASTPVKLMLSHDPTHWDAQIRPMYPDIDVTFSGHTHGMQLGVETPLFRFSPSQLQYKQWAGLYQEGKQYLYVNRGFGFLGFSGRVGIWPEITVIQLKIES